MLRIVIAEDEEMIRRGLVETIDWAALGAEVVGEAADGIEALEVLRAEHPDAVFADIRMPRLSGLDFAENVRAAGDDTPIIFLTSYADFSYAQRAVRLGAFDYLLKPVDEVELARVLGALAKRQEAKSGEDASRLPVLVDWSLDDADGNPYVSDVLAAVQTRYRERLSIEELADAEGVSASYLSRKLKEATGHTFVSLLARTRVQASLPLLQARRLRVYEVAEATGFGDYKNFSQVFKKYLQVSPRAWCAAAGEENA